MKKLLFLLLISFHSTQSLAKVGDVYFCNQVKSITITQDGVDEHKLEKFKFKWNEGYIKFSEEVWSKLAAHIDESYDETFTATKDMILINFRFED